MTVIKKPDLSDPKLRAKLAKGMGHNYYGEPAWPNDLLYIFPVVILGTIAILVGLGVLEPYAVGEPADPFATPLEILPEWYLFPTFNILRILPNKLLGIAAMAAVPRGRASSQSARSNRDGTKSGYKTKGGQLVMTDASKRGRSRGQ